jgi:hypothetical protein
MPDKDACHMSHTDITSLQTAQLAIIVKLYARGISALFMPLKSPLIPKNWNLIDVLAGERIRINKQNTHQSSTFKVVGTAGP